MSTKTRGPHHHNHHHGHESNAEQRETPAMRKLGEEERSRLIEYRAYGLWEQAGKPDGDAARIRFWGEAEQEINATLTQRMNEAKEKQR